MMRGLPDSWGTVPYSSKALQCGDEASWRACGLRRRSRHCHLPSFSPSGVHGQPRARPFVPTPIARRPSPVARRPSLAAHLPDCDHLADRRPLPVTCHPPPAPSPPLLCPSPLASAPSPSARLAFRTPISALVARPSTPARHGIVSSGPPLDGSTEHSSLHRPR
jgi:hypothetical protein